MIHLLILIICIVTVEIFIQANFLTLLFSLCKIAGRVMHIILKANISEHWKEKIIPVYALRIMKYSLQILFILSLVLCLFFIAGCFLDNFFDFTLSFAGILESVTFAYGYLYLRNSLVR